MNAYEIVDSFEQTIAEYAGSKYGVAVDSCCNALFLCCIYRNIKGHTVEIPKRTYPGVACSIIHAGGKIKFINKKWESIYELSPFCIIDSALSFFKNMYIPRSLYCLSFHVKKHLPIGRGGMILCDKKEEYEWFKKARFDGRNQVPLNKDKITSLGWNCYLTPEQAARGMTLFDLIKDKNLIDLPVAEQNYPDLSQVEVYK